MADTPDLLAIAKLLEDLPEHGLQQGRIGTIVEIFNNPSEAYMVEFVEESGSRLPVLTREQFEILPC